MKLKALKKPLVVAITLAAFLTAVPARAAFHLWTIREVYSDASGSLQFIELFDAFGGQNFISGLQIQVSNTGNTEIHTFNVPGGALPGSSLNRALLFGTASLQAAGAPAPDYIIPNNFVFTAGGTITYFALDGGPYGALPIDGVNSRTWSGGGSAANSPQNYAGQSGSVSVPEPAALGLLGLAAAFGLARRRNVTR